MTIYITATSPFPNLYVDYLYLITKDGKEIGVDWDETDFVCRNGIYDGRHKGVYFDDEYANGRVKEIQDATLGYVKLEWSGADEEPDDIPDTFKITSLLFEDYDEEKEAYVKYELKV